MLQKSWRSPVEVGRLSPLFTVGLDAPSQTVVGAHNSEVEEKGWRSPGIELYRSGDPMGVPCISKILQFYEQLRFWTCHVYAIHIMVNHGYTTSAVGSSLCKRSFVAAPCYPPNFPGAVNLVCELLWLLLVAELVAALTPWRHLRRPTPARLTNWCQSLATKPRSTKSTGSEWCSMKGRCIFLAGRKKRPSTWCRLWRVVLGRP